MSWIFSQNIVRLCLGTSLVNFDLALVNDQLINVYYSFQIDGIILRTKDPRLTELGLPEYPNLPATTESFKVYEIRRTLVFDNLTPEVSGFLQL